jgi:predicted secreted protein
MNKVLIVAVLALCISLSLAAPKKQNFMDTKTVLAEMDKDHFGSTFISAVALNMATNSPVEDITLLIEEII